ncbi:MAG: hypothetical protein HC787_04630 [Nostocaceae cyanobacterium CSU_2_110]|nr:hypothetical protein [Nostocaceae cyanobacterium CSU_2_110]
MLNLRKTSPHFREILETSLKLDLLQWFYGVAAQSLRMHNPNHNNAAKNLKGDK